MKMGLVKWLVLASAIVIGLYVSGIFSPELEEPKMVDAWWGRGKTPVKDDLTIKEFKVKVSNKSLNDLKARLDSTRYSDDLEDSKFHYGFPTVYLKENIEYWRNNYDWRKQEKILNMFPQYKTKIEGIDVHFIRVKPKTAKTTRPLMLIHGWPGSVWEFYKILPMLTDPKHFGGSDSDAFEVIVPSIPGYGFSGQPHQQGFSQVACAQVFAKLMSRLGFQKYYVQGGDWGSLIATIMAQAYPEHVQGLHLNVYSPPMTGLATAHQVAAYILPSIFLSKEIDRELWRENWSIIYLLREMGYAHIQATKPDTVGTGLNDSPAGLAAYILEKFSGWTKHANIHKPDGGLTEKFTLDELLTNVMIYWWTNTIKSSQRFYKEYFLDERNQVWDKFPVTVPTGLAAFPEEIMYCPEVFATHKFKDIVQFTDLPRGGHFAAFEEPILLAEDIWKFARKLESRPKQK